MENPLEAAHEEIKHAEHIANARLKVIVTVTVLAVTLLTTLAGVLAAVWSAKQTETQQVRQQANAAAVEAGLHGVAERSALDQQRDDRREAAWRSVDLDYLATNAVSDRAVSDALAAQARAAQDQADSLAITLPSTPDEYDARVAETQTHALELSEEARAEAQESVGWLDKHNSALAVVSILALALFLLGLTFTIANRPTQVGFTALAILMTVVGGARLIQIAARGIPKPTTQCVAQYAEGVTESQTDFAKGAETLKGVVARCPTYSEAWTALAQVELYLNLNDKGLADAIENQQKAVDTASAKSATLYNDLGVMQILDKNYTAARANLDRALAIEPDNEVIMASQAELAVVQGDADSGRRQFDRIVERISDRGPYYLTGYFAALRLDELFLIIYGGESDAVKQFYRHVREVEVSLEQLHRPEPASLHGATITHVVARPSKGMLGKAGCATFAFDFSGFREGDRLSIRFYQYGVTYEPSAGVADSLITAHPRNGNDISVMGAGFIKADYRNLPLPSGSQTMEIYLDGHLMASKTFDMPKGTANDI